MITLLVAAMVSIPLWVWLSKKIDKRNAYILGMTLTLFAVLLFAFFADRVGSSIAIIFMTFAGIGFSSHYVVPWAMTPDTIEFGYLNSGVRREGIYYSIWTFVVALGGAFAGFLVGQGLALYHYVPDVSQTTLTIRGIRLLFGVLPVFFIIIANSALLFYPLNKKYYADVLLRIKNNKTE